MSYYAYIWMRSTQTNYWPVGSPYYIGKGSKYRAFVQEDHRVKVPKDSSRIQIISCRDEESAKECERFLISYYGRIDLGTGCLRNLTAGGDGVTSEGISPETREKQRQRMLGKKYALGHTFNPSLEQCQKGAQAAAEKKVGIFAPGFDRSAGLRKSNALLTPEERRSRAIKASESIPKEQRVINGRLGALKSSGKSLHVRWHLNRSIVDSSCKFCLESECTR